MAQMEPLLEHQQPSSDARIAKWVGALAALTLGAVLVRRSRALADD
jgi:hypothetical protein